MWRTRPSDGPWSALLRWRGDNWIISAGNQLGLCACDGTRVKQRRDEREREVGERERGWGSLIDYVKTPPSLSSTSLLSHPAAASAADLPDNRDQIAHFHLNELSPNKRQGSGDRLRTPNTRRSREQMGAQCGRKEKRGGEKRRAGGTLKIYLYMLKKMLIRRVKNGGDFVDSH